MSEVDTPETPDQLELEGFEETTEAMGNLLPVEGEPVPAEAVETSEAEETPAEAEAETPEEASAEAPEESEVAQTVNFDGFSDDSRSLYERLLEEGHVTAEQVEQERLNTMHRADYTRRRMKEKADYEAKLATIDERKEDLAKLDEIRSDDALYERWLRLNEPAEAEDGDELVDRKTTEEIAEQKLEKLLAERDSRTKAEKDAYNVKHKALVDTGTSLMEELKIDLDTLNGYLNAEQQTLPEDVDPILTVTPEDMRGRITKRHELATRDAEIASLREQLAGKTAKNERTAKQSLPPDRRVSVPQVDDPLAQTEAELGLDPDWNNVTGWGFPNQ